MSPTPDDLEEKPDRHVHTAGLSLTSQTLPNSIHAIFALTLASAAGIWQQLRPPAGGRWAQLYLAAYATLVMAGYAASARFIFFGANPEGMSAPIPPEGPLIDAGAAWSTRLQAGGWLMLVGSTLALMGAVAARLLACTPTRGSPHKRPAQRPNPRRGQADIPGTERSQS